jgi:hypothetical protein
MSPFSQFNLVWGRCNELSALHRYFQSKATAVLNFDELLRAEWVARVSALDLYMHEIISQQLVEIFRGLCPAPPGFKKYGFTGETLLRMRTDSIERQASAFELDVRSRLSFLSFQDPEKIADGVRLISEIELWNELAIRGGAVAKDKVAKAKSLKLKLSTIVDRRNKIAHEGDLKPGVPRETWEISPEDLKDVANFLVFVVESIDSLVWDKRRN